MSRQREYQKRMSTQGRCVICGDAQYVKGYCEKHYRARMAKLQEKRDKDKQQHTCSSCGKDGHNKRTCPALRDGAVAGETA